MKNHVLISLLLLPVLFLTGCSDYPSDGIVDTRMIREESNIEEITGSVYGIKDGADEAVKALVADQRVTRSIDRELWDAVKSDLPEKEWPALTLSYNDIDGSTVLSAYDDLIVSVKKDYKEAISKNDQEISELEKKKSEYELILAGIQESKNQHDEFISEQVKAFKDASTEVEVAKQSYNNVFASAVKEVSEAAESKGISGSYNDNMIGRYRSIDFNKQKSSPQTCPVQKGYFSVDVRDINNQCAYLIVPRNVQGTVAEDDVKKIIATKFKEFLKAQQTLGQKGSWGSEPTGLFLTQDKAKKDLKNAEVKAQSNYGSTKDRKYKYSNTKQMIARINKDIDGKNDDGYIQRQVLPIFVKTPKSYDEAMFEYKKSINNHFYENYMDKASDITMGNSDGVTVGVFEDINSGYTHLVGVSDILIESNSRKQILRSIDILSMNDPGAADALTFVVTKDNVDRRGRDVSEEKIVDQVIESYIKYATN